MIDHPFRLDRRVVLGSLGAALIWPAPRLQAQGRSRLRLEAVPATLNVKPGEPPVPIWQLAGGPDAGPLHFKRGDSIDVTLTNRLPIPVALGWLGLDGMPGLEPLTGTVPVQPNATATYPVTFRHAGTMLATLDTLGSGQARPTTARPVIVSETEPVTTDRDEVLLFQDWRVRPDGTASVPGTDPGDAATSFTVNGQPTIDIIVSPHDRLRLRLINSSQRIITAIKISDLDVRVMAIDGQPSEPFLARDGLIVLTPGARVDAIIDAAQLAGATATITLLDGRTAQPIGKIVTSEAKPSRIARLPAATALPSNALPTQLDLKSALRIDLPLGTPDWLAPNALTAATPPAFKVKRGRIVVLALTNRAARPSVFHLHGHHVRLLDRLDDGWKPFWLDTLAIEPGQTQRVAFAAEFPGLYPMQSVMTDWAAPRLVRSYLVE